MTWEEERTNTGEPARNWLNRNVVGMSVTSLLSDAGHEMATTVLPAFLTTIGAPAAALGAIEGVADGISSFVKLGVGWYSDRIGRRKAITVGGYALTGTATGLFALALGWPLVLLGRCAAWLGRGIRGPLRDAMLSESVPAKSRGKAFGFHRAADTLGAIVGPLAAIGLLAVLSRQEVIHPSSPFRVIFWLTLIPGIGSALAFALLVTERRRARNDGLRFWGALKSLPRPYLRLLTGVGLFGMGDFAHALMILAATQLLTPGHGIVQAAQIAGLLYAARNIVYATASFPIGGLSDHVGRRGLLALGYVMGAMVGAGFAVAFLVPVRSPAYLLVLFALAGGYIAAEDALERAIVADYVGSEVRATGYGLMAAVNGVGDLVASAVVGVLWTAVSPVAGFGYAAAMMLAGAVVLYRVR